MPNPTAGNCFHPIDDPVMRSGVAPCFDPGPQSASAVTPVAMCFHPAGQPQAVAPVAICYHPGDDLATDLHRALTGADERDLAALAGRS